MTEASSFTSINFNSKKNSIGQVLPWFKVAIKKKSKLNNNGEIVIKENIHGLLTKGYFKDKNATKELLKKDGLHTGDVANIDKKGNLFYIGRLKDSVRVRGENISAWEIETTLNNKIFISESAILKVKADIGEFDMVALIIPKNYDLDIIKIINDCKKDFSKNYIPRYWCLVDRFPRTPTLRIDKKNIMLNSYKFFDRINNNYIKFK